MKKVVWVSIQERDQKLGFLFFFVMPNLFTATMSEYLAESQPQALKTPGPAWHP